MTISQTLANFVSRIDYESIPQAVRQRAAVHLLDTIGVAFASASFPFAQTSLAALKGFGGGEYDVIGMAARLQLRDAVLMNGILTHGLDYDDNSIFGRVHPSSFCVPCTLGAGAYVHASGREVIAAYVAGMESAIRIGAAAKGGFQRAGFHATAVVGAFGCVLIAGKLLKLTPAQLASAQGIVYSTASGNQEFTSDDAWTKRMHAGWAGVCGITAGMLARGGFIGPGSAYEGRFGLYKTYLGAGSGAADVSEATAGLGERWELERVAIKPIPACHFNHAVIDAAIALATEHDIAPRDIRAVRVLMPEAAINTVCEPKERKRAPDDTYGAQFSVYFAAACGIVRRRFTLKDVETESLGDPEIRALCAKVDYAIDPDTNFPRHYSAEVLITLNDGRELRRREDVNRGSADRPLEPQAIERKFLDNAERVTSRAQAEALLEAILAIERARDVSSVTSKLSLPA